jgi:predicted cupin superfamily sugar epimerase
VLTAEEVIQLLDLKPLPQEGGFYRETYRSPAQMPASALPRGYTGARSLGTAIFYLLTSAQYSFSAIHRVPGDEMFHFHLGDPVEMFLFNNEAGSTRVVLGPDLRAGQQLQFVAPGGVWQGARLAPGGRFALLGTTMSPGFDMVDFELGNREELLRQFPDSDGMIRCLTRV